MSRTDASERTRAFSEFLNDRFEACVVEKRVDYRPELLTNIDVVLIDWSQSERLTNDDSSPVGPLEEWEKPTVFLGSTGLLMATTWQVIGDAG